MKQGWPVHNHIFQLPQATFDSLAHPATVGASAAASAKMTNCEQHKCAFHSRLSTSLLRGYHDLLPEPIVKLGALSESTGREFVDYSWPPTLPFTCRHLEVLFLVWSKIILPEHTYTCAFAAR